jgi:nicotinamide-nucleotide amidase
VRNQRPRSVVITVGDEILGGFIQDTNSHLLARRLREAGFAPIRIEVVGDDVEDIAAAIRRALGQPQVARVVVSGGLGPTADDRTLEAVALALDRPLEEHPEALAHVAGIVERMWQAKWVETPEISEPNRKMTRLPRGAEAIPNRRGMAPGVAVALDPLPDSVAGGDDGRRWLLVLPGVPRELATMLDEEVVPRYLTGGITEIVEELRLPFAVEADYAGVLDAVTREYPDVQVGSYPQTEARELVIRVRGTDRDRVRRAVVAIAGVPPRSTSARRGRSAEERDAPPRPDPG